MNTKKLFTLLGIGLVLLGIVAFLKFGVTAQTLWNLSSGGKWLLPLISVAALVDSINPCAFSILLLTIAFLLSLGKMRRDILKLGGIYILGIFLVYILIGLGILQALHIFNTPHFMAKLGASIIIILGTLNLINEFFPSFPIKLRIPQIAHHRMAVLMEQASVPAVFLLGILVGLCEFPCTGGPYLMILGLLHDQVTYLTGIGYLALYNLLFISPLIIMLFIASDSALIEKVREWKKVETKNMRIWGGIAMIALGVLIFFL